MTIKNPTAYLITQQKTTVDTNLKEERNRNKIKLFFLESKEFFGWFFDCNNRVYVNESEKEVLKAIRAIKKDERSKKIMVKWLLRNQKRMEENN